MVFLAVAACGTDEAQTGATGDTGGPNASSKPVEPAATTSPGAIILDLDDLPSSWREQPAVAGGANTSRSCLDSAIDTGDEFGPGSAADSLAASFAQSDLGPFLVAKVATPVPDVQASFDMLVDRVAACDGTTDAAGFTTAVEVLTFPTIGDEAFAAQADAANPNGSTVSYLLAAARVDSTLVVAAHIVTLGELDVGLVEGVVRTMVGRA